ncbi:MAG: HAD family hydrolase [Lachnospiraceae bacterium]
MIKLVIFDLDGTAVDTLESLAYTVNRVMRRLGLREMPVDNFRYYAGDGARKMVKRCLKDAGDPTASHLEEALEIYREEFKRGCTYHVKPFPELTETLEDLREYGVFLAICTNKGQPYAEAVIKKVYGKNMFDYILGEGSGFPRKPEPDGALHIAEHLGVTPEECVYVGDTNTDMKTGLAAEMYTVGVTWGFRTREELESFHPDRVIDRPQELLDIQM